VAGEESPLGIIHIIIFFVLWFIAEIIFRIYRSRESPYKTVSTTMTIDEFETRV
jgi:hypothetical protein